MWRKVLAALALLAAGASRLEAADPLTLIVFPRGNQEAMTAAYVEPFRKETGVGVKVLSYDGETDELRAMTQKGKTVWDLIQVETRTLEQGCATGLFEKIDPAKVSALPDLVPGAVTECGVGAFVWAQALVYDADRVKAAPASWADFWDVKKFPGKRGLRRSAKYTLEIALLADGVAPKDVYRVLATREGVDRAFRKLDAIRSHTVWWDAAQQPSLFLAAGRVDMSASYTFYVNNEQKRGRNLRIVWNNSLYDYDNWAIPKGTPRTADAYRFIAFASRPENQRVFVEEMPYGPVNVKALPLLDARLAAALPTAPANFKTALAVNIPFWIKYGPDLEARFAKWAPRADQQEVEEHDHDEAAGDAAHEHGEPGPTRGDPAHGGAPHAH